MTRSPVDTLTLLVALAALVLLFGGAPLGLAIPAGGLVWMLLRASADSDRRLSRTLRLLILSYPLYIGVVQFSYWRSGQQGVDFGIFSQLIYQVAHHDRFTTSLISTEWQNFITHHFSPFLIILGGISKLGVSSECTLIAAHVVAVAFLVCGLLAFWRISDTSRHALALTATALLLPGVRRALGWETHDEVLALPCIIWSLVAHLQGKATLRLLLLFPPLLFKETFGLGMFTTGIAYYLADRFGSTTRASSERRAALLTALCGLGFFILTTKVFPWWLWVPTFDPSTRLLGLSDLLDQEFIHAKARWALITFTPAIPFVFLHTRHTLRTTIILMSPAAYNIAAIMSTNFPAMMDPYNYYSITPALLVFCALSLPVLRHRKAPVAILAALSLAVICGSTVRSSKIVRQAFTAPSAYAELRVFVPQDSSVIVDDYTASVLADNSYLLRVFHARRSKPGFDYIVTTKSLPEHLSDALKRRSVLCHETPRYHIRCRKPKPTLTPSSAETTSGK
jgi:uncharacterized membrane protein